MYTQELKLKVFTISSEQCKQILEDIENYLSSETVEFEITPKIMLELQKS